MPQKVYSIQPRFKPPGDPQLNSWTWVDFLFQWGLDKSLPFYPSPARDMYLAELWKQEPVLSGAISTVIDKMATTNWYVKGGKTTARRYAQMFHEVDGGQGWSRFISMSFQDFITTNRGSITELGRTSPTKRIGAVLGLQHLDSTRIMYTGDPAKPWAYLPDGAPSSTMWAENIIQVVSIPSSRDRYRGSGLCAVERLKDSIGLMVGWLTHDRQQVGDLPPEALLIINGLSFEQVKTSHEQYRQRREQMMAQMGETNPIYAGFWLMGSDDPSTQVAASVVNLRNTQGYDRNGIYEWWVKLVSLELEQAVGEFWLIQHEGATKAVEGIQADMERAKGPGRYAREFEWQLNWRVLPEGVRFAFDAQDDQQDEIHADIMSKNIDNLTKLAKIGAEYGEPLVALDDIREMAIEWGVLPPEMSKEQTVTTISSRLKEFTRYQWIVNRSFEEFELQPLSKGRTAEKMNAFAQLLEAAYAPSFLEAPKHEPGKHDQLTHGHAQGGGAASPIHVGGVAYLPIRAYGNINGAKAKAKKYPEGAVKVVRYQGKYWVVESPKTAKPQPKLQQQGSSPFRDAASSGKVASVSDLGGGICDADLVAYQDDGKGVWKGLSSGGYHDGNSEVAAYRLNQVLGLDVVPETVYASVKGKKGTSQLFIEGATIGQDLETKKIPRKVREKVLALDGIIGNGDRHGGNYLQGSDGKLWAIDHGHASWGLGATVFNDSMLAVWNESDENGVFKLSPELLGSLSKVSRQDFDSAFEGVSESNHVNKENAWSNLQGIIKRGGVK